MKLALKAYLGWGLASLGILSGLAIAADPEPTSSEKPKPNSSVQKLDRRKHPGEIHATGAPQVGRSQTQQGSSMGLGVTIPLHKSKTSDPKLKPEDDSKGQ